MPAPGANLHYGKTSFLTSILLRKFGFRPKQIVNMRNPTNSYNGALDDGTTFPRLIGICYKLATAPVTNTTGDNPTGKGDLCIVDANTGAAPPHQDVANITIYRCTAYTNSTTFTWAQLI